MAKKSSLPSPNHEEIIWGFGYLAIQLLILPSALNFINDFLPTRLSSAELNFAFYLINFLAVSILFHRFLGASGTQAMQHPVQCGEAVILGYVGYYLLTMLVNWCIRKLDPSFTNANNDVMYTYARNNWFLTALGSIILVPPVEECLYRGLFFRTLYSKNKAAAYIVSIAAFSMIHLLGTLSRYTPLQMLLCFLQYVPAGLCLAWSYIRGGSIFAPIFIHALINAVAVQAVR